MVWINKKENWKNLQTIISIETKKDNPANQSDTNGTKVYITSLLARPSRLNEIVRGHWDIENRLHWCLDVVFKEDLSTKQAGNAAENFSMINKACLSILRNDTSKKGSLKRKRLKAGWSNEYLETLLFK